jgi:hypothetical protein
VCWLTVVLLGLWVLASPKNLKFTMKQVGFIYFSYATLRANIICHVIKADARFSQTWVGLQLTSGCQDDRGTVDETTR